MGEFSKVLLWSTSCISPYSCLQSETKLQTSQSSCLIKNGITHGAHILSYIPDIPDVPSSPSSSEAVAAAVPSLSLSVMLSPALPSPPANCCGVPVDFYVECSLLRCIKPHCSRSRHLGMGNVGERGWCPEQGTQSRFMAWASSSEEIRRLQLLQSTHLAVRSHQKFRQDLQSEGRTLLFFFAIGQKKWTKYFGKRMQF